MNGGEIFGVRQCIDSAVATYTICSWVAESKMVVGRWDMRRQHTQPAARLLGDPVGGRSRQCHGLCTRLRPRLSINRNSFVSVGIPLCVINDAVKESEETVSFFVAGSSLCWIAPHSSPPSFNTTGAFQFSYIHFIEDTRIHETTIER